MAAVEWRPWGVLAGLFLLTAGLVAYVIAPASILPLFADAFQVGKPAASAAISAVFLTWALLQIPGGFVLDRYDNRLLVSLAAIVFILAAAGGLLASSYPTYLVTRLVTGACAAFVFVGSVNVLNRVLPEDRRALGIGVYIASPPSGLAVAQYTAPLITESYGWRAPTVAYLLVATAGLGIFVVLLGRRIESPGKVTVQQFAAALREPSILLVSVAGFCTYAIWTFLNTWMPTYGTEVLGIDLAAAGAATALVPLAGIVARPGGGWLADLLDGRRRPVIVTSFVATIPLLYLLSAAPSPSAFAVLLASTGAAVNLSVGLYLVSVHTLADAATPGTSLSVLATFSQLGNLIAPIVGGWLIVEVSWSASFGFVAVLAIVGLVTIMFVPATT